MNGAVAAAGSEFLVNTTTTGLQTDAAVTGLSGGGFVITWTDNSATGADTSGAAIRAQMYDSSGSKVGSAFLVNSTTQNAQTQSAVTALANGGFVVTWTDASLLGGDSDTLSVKARLFDASGNAVGNEFLVNTATRFGQNTPTITSLTNGGFVVSWADASGVGDTSGTGIKAQIYAADGTKAGGEFLLNTTKTNSQLYPAITGLSGGGFVATWMDNSGQGGDPTAPSIKAQLFSATGTKIGTEFLVNTTVAASQDQPATVGLSGGGFVIVWRDTSGQGDTSASGIKGQLYNASGARVGGEFLINTTTLNTQDQPTVSALPDGGFVVSWEDNSTLASDPSGFSIRAQMFDSTGAKAGAEWGVNTVTAGNQQLPAIATLTSGAIVVGWTDYSGQNGDTDGGIKAQMYTPTQGTITSLTLTPPQVSEAAVQNVPVAALQATGALNALYSYSIIDDSTGGAFGIDGSNLVVANSELLDYEASPSATVTVQATDTFGNSFSQIFTLGVTDSVIEHRYAGETERIANSVTLNGQQLATITALTNGNYLISWADSSGTIGDASNYGVAAQIVDAHGNPIGNEFLVNSQTLNAQSNPSAAALPNGFVITWVDSSGVGADTSSSGIKAQLFDLSGTPQGSEFLVNQSTANGQTVPSVAALSSGFVITWTDASLLGGDNSVSSIKAQLFDGSGNRVGSEFLVNTNTANRQDTPVAAGLTNGGFVIAWDDSSAIGGDSSKDAIKAQIFDGAGNKVGSEFLVNTQTQSNQQQEAITGLADGGFVIAWADASGQGGDSDNFGIKLQIYDASGAKRGGEMLANTTTAGAQIAPTLTALPDGDFIVSWADYGGTGPERGTPGVKAQLFTADGARIGGEFIVASTLVGGQYDPALGAQDGNFMAVWTDASAQGADNSGTAVRLKAFDRLPDQGGPPPIVAKSDLVSATEDLPLTIDPLQLLANDVDTAGLPLTVTGVTAVSGGSVQLNTDGTIGFTPNPNFNGQALFTYTVNDGVDSATGRVAVAVAAVNDPPTATNDVIGISQNGGTIAASALLANDTDPDLGDHLAITNVPGSSSGGATLSLASGNVVYNPGNAFAALAAGETATDSFSYTISDTAGATSSATVALTITGVDDAPYALALAGGQVDENSPGGTVVGSLSASDVDHGDALTYSLTDNAGGRFVVDPTTGVVTVANGAVLDYEKQPTFTITGRATDTSGLYASGSFTISLNNLPEPKSWTGDNGVNVFTAPTNDLWTINGLAGADVLTGNASADTIYGGSGADVLDGAGGADTLVGGIGDDSYYVDNVGDQVVENYGEGTDIIYSSVNYTISPNVENLTQIGTGDISATGTDLANVINGNSGANTIYGRGGGDLIVGNDGNDALYGEDGNDNLQGGNGDDLLAGGAGSDRLTGGAGADTFVLGLPTVAGELDTVTDFTPGTDVFALPSSAFAALSSAVGGTLPASAFRSGTQAATADQHVIYNPSTGALYYDPDGVGGAQQVQVAFLSTKPLLSADNFSVV